MGPTDNKFYGVATVGTKGQIVIPADAREDMGLKPGDKVIIVGKKHESHAQGMIGVCSIDAAETFVNAMAAKVTEMQSKIQASK